MRGAAKFSSSVGNSSARWEEGGDIASISVPLALGSVDTGSRAVHLHVLGSVAWPRALASPMVSASGTHR